MLLIGFRYVGTKLSGPRTVPVLTLFVSCVWVREGVLEKSYPQIFLGSFQTPGDTELTFLDVEDNTIAYKTAEKLFQLRSHQNRPRDLAPKKFEIVQQPQIYSDFFQTFRIVEDKEHLNMH